MNALNYSTSAFVVWILCTFSSATEAVCSTTAVAETTAAAVAATEAVGSKVQGCSLLQTQQRHKQTQQLVAQQEQQQHAVSSLQQQQQQQQQLQQQQQQLLAASRAKTSRQEWWHNKKEKEKLPYFDLVIMIPCQSEKDRQKRDAIRSTWANYLDKKGNCIRGLCASNTTRSNRTVKLVFLVGEDGNKSEIAEEAKQHGDLEVLTGYSPDEYSRLAAKTRASLRHVTNHYRFGLLLKTDTDAWVFVDRLLQVAEDKKLFRIEDDPNPGVYGGAFETKVPDSEGKYADPIYPSISDFHRYPRFAKGPGYMLSPTLCEFIAGLSDDDHLLPSFSELPGEDVSVGFWLQVVNHTKVDLPVSCLCGCCGNSGASDEQRNEFVVDHYVTIEDMEYRGRLLLSGEMPCKPW
eukprot:TRINITY_DN4153_c0_g1_i1.p1 TRINITY_DN4153_c0_g1~~TRINITY_DN4153_c0_g1_i1.p1  ORF type:complete len:405 (+),score=88.41 TRINITY_DN4153_c0_g1_i1:50-1264(+)